MNVTMMEQMLPEEAALRSLEDTALELAESASGLAKQVHPILQQSDGDLVRGHEHVYRMARRHLGIAPSVYVNRIRMQYAAMVLGSSDQSKSRIALDCGIENMRHFYRLFCARYGVTPRTYRTVHARSSAQPTGSTSLARIPRQP